MRSFLRVSGERNKFLLNSNSGVNFTRGSAFQFDFNAARTPSFVPESPSVTTPADQQSLKFTSDSFTNLDTQAFSLGTPGTFKPMTADEISNANTGWLDFTNAEFTGNTIQGPNIYDKVNEENKKTEAEAQKTAEKLKNEGDKQTQALLKALMELFAMFSGSSGMGAIASTAGASTGNATTPTATTTPPPVATPTVVAA